VESAFLEYSKN